MFLVYMNLLGKSHHTVPRMKVITCGARLDNPAYCDLTQKNRSVCNKEKTPIKSFHSPHIVENSTWQMMMMVYRLDLCIAGTP